MLTINRDECAAAGIDPDEVRKIARSLARSLKQADALGLTVFSDGSLRYDDGGAGKLLVASGLGANLDGGDGAWCQDAEGLWRGETA